MENTCRCFLLCVRRETYVDCNPKSHNVLGITPVAIIDRQLPFEYTIASRSTDVMVVMAALTIPVSAEENLGVPIDIRVDIIHLEPVTAVAFPAAAVVRTQAQHGEAIRGIHQHLLGVPIQEELTALRSRVDIVEAENASLRARIKTTEAIEKITRNRERQARIKIEQQLAAVQESQRQDREDFRKLKELVTSQFGQRSYTSCFMIYVLACIGDL
ncbi:hypothetical protein Tco_0902545 [Tanacetum coccineum]